MVSLCWAFIGFTWIVDPDINIMSVVMSHMKCQCQITKICWQDHIRNSEVAARTGLGPVLDLITHRRNSVFGHIARLSEDTPAHQAHRCHVGPTLGHLPDQSWKRRPGCPNNRGLSSYAGTTTSRHQLTCGEDPPHVVIREWRYGPRRLRVDDDGDVTKLIKIHVWFLLRMYSKSSMLTRMYS